MTVAVAVPINTYLGTGTINVYAFTFPVFTSSQISVSVVNAAGTIYSLTLAVDYLVTGLSAAGTPASNGSITLINAGQAWLTGANLATGYTLTIQSAFPLSQPTSVRNQGDFYPEAIEDALDNLEYQIQQLKTLITAPTAPLANILINDQVNGQIYQVVSRNGVIGLATYP